MKIRALFGLTRMPDGKVIALLKGSLNGLSDHADTFVKAPIDLETYRNGIVAYEAAIPGGPGWKQDRHRAEKQTARRCEQNVRRVGALRPGELQRGYGDVPVVRFPGGPNNESGTPAPGSTHYRLSGSRPCYRSIEAQDRLGCESVEL